MTGDDVCLVLRVECVMWWSEGRSWEGGKAEGLGEGMSSEAGQGLKQR